MQHDDDIVRDGERVRVRMVAMDATQKAISSGPVELHDAHGCPPGLRPGFCFGGDRKASEDARSAEIIRLSDRWRGDKADAAKTLDAAEVYDAYLTRTANAWRGSAA